MIVFGKIKKAITQPRILGIYLLCKFAWLFPDRLYLALMFRLKMGYWMDFDNPQTFNEKLQWLKLYNRRPEYTQMVDKYAVKEYVASIIGEQYIIPTLGVWDCVEDIDFDSLPNQFVLKTTHGGGGGGIVICKDKSRFDVVRCRQILKKSLDSCIYKRYGEWPYKDVVHRIIAEKYIVEDESTELNDYKFFCFSGQLQTLKVDFNRFIAHQANYYDRNFNLMLFGEAVCPPDYLIVHTSPKGFDAMVDIVHKLSKDIPFVRIDLYNVEGKIYFGEMTFFPASGLGQFVPKEWDYTFGKWLALPEKRA